MPYPPITHSLPTRSFGDAVSAGSADTASRHRLLWLLLVAAFATTIMVAFHDRSWWPPDEGGFSHRADRVLAGEVLNRDIQDIRPGLINFTNALAFAVFGDDLVSLRYPLIVLGVLQACLMLGLFQRRDPVAGAVAAMALTSLSIVLFLNPTAHWYSLFLAIALIGAIAGWPRQRMMRIEVIGFLVATLVLYRQLSGVFAAIGALTFLLCEAQAGAGRAQDGTRRLARGLILIMAAGLAGYLAAKADVLAFVLFGVWPLGLLFRAWFATTADDRAALGLLARLGRGAAVAATPLVLYHLAHGSLATWFDDIVVSAVALSNLDFITKASFGFYIVGGLRQIAELGSAIKMVNGLFWIMLPLIPAVLGYAVLRGAGQCAGRGVWSHPLPVLAVFYAPVSIHYQIPNYLYFTVGLSLAAVLWIHAGARSGRRSAALALAGLLALVGLGFHAGQPASRGPHAVLAGKHVPQAPSGLDRASLVIAPASAELYSGLVALIQREVPPDGTILALPANPELYFLSRRANPLRFFNSGIGLRRDRDVAAVLRVLADDPPRLVFHRPADKYNTPRTGDVMDAVRAGYDLIERRGGFDIYRHRGGRPGSGSPSAIKPSG